MTLDEFEERWKSAEEFRKFNTSLPGMDKLFDRNIRDERMISIERKLDAILANAGLTASK